MLLIACLLGDRHIGNEKRDEHGNARAFRKVEKVCSHRHVRKRETAKGQKGRRLRRAGEEHVEGISEEEQRLQNRTVKKKQKKKILLLVVLLGCVQSRKKMTQIF